MFSFGLRIILLLIIISGAIAWVGDNLGRTIGRKRLSLFGLRPRTTATITTLISGTLISLISLAVILVISPDARTGLFGLDQLRAQIDHSRQGKVLFKANEVIYLTLIKDNNLAEKQLKEVLSASDAYIRSFGVESPKHLIYIGPKDFSASVKKLQPNSVVAVIVTRNTLFGEVAPVKLKITPNQLIYPAQTIITQITIEPTLSIPQIEQKIKLLLTKAHQKAKKTGVIPDQTGSVGSLPYSKIFILAKKINIYRHSIALQAFAKKNIYSIGPLEIDFKIKP